MKFENFSNQNLVFEFFSKLIDNNTKNITLKRIEKTSKHPNFIVFINSQPKFVLKNTKYARKEEKFFKYNRSFNTFEAIYFGDDFIITKYEEETSQYESPFFYIDDLARAHGSQLVDKLDYSCLKEDSLFLNRDTNRTIIRINKHPDLVRKFYPDIDKLIKFLEHNKRECSEKIEILTHGDIHGGNIVKTKYHEFVYMDFELSLVERPTWDLARVIFSIEPIEVKGIINRYINKINKYTQNSVRSSLDDLERMALADFVFKFTNVGIGVQQHEYFKQWVPKYTNQINKHFDQIIKDAH